MNNTSQVNHSRVAVLGLGAMGTALARTLLAAGLEVSVWSRTPRELAGIGLGGARQAESPLDAVGDASVVLVCVLDHPASRSVIDAAAARIGEGVPVVNLSTGTPDQAVESAAAAAGLGLDYVTGAIMVPTPMIGTERNLILYAGAEQPIEAARTVLTTLGGTVDVLGRDHALPPVLDIAMLDIFFAGMYAFLHSAALVRARGVEPDRYLPYATGIVQTLLGSLPGLVESLRTRAYDRGEARLDMCLSFLEHIVASSSQAGIDPTLPAVIRDATRRQADLGHGAKDWDRVAEGLTPEPAGR